MADPTSVHGSSPIPLPMLDWLAARYPAAKRQTLRRMLQDGRVSVNGKRVVSARLGVTPQDQVAVAGRQPQAPTSASRGGGNVRVIFEDDDVIVVDKPAGLLTSTVPRERRPTLLAKVRSHLGPEPSGGRVHRVGLIHRLDRDASGLLVFSRNHEAYRSLKRQFFEHTVERVYTAVVEGVPTPRAGKIRSRLVERADGTVYSTKEPGKGESAQTDYETLEEGRGRSLVRVTLHTGRKHQIRVHLSERGVPIVGDGVYGNKLAVEANKKSKFPRAPRLMLAATKLSFDHPRTGRRLSFELPMPETFAAAFALTAAGRADDQSGRTTV